MLPEALSADLCSLKEGVDPRLPCRTHGVRCQRQETPPRIYARHHAFRRAADLCAASHAFDGKPDAALSQTAKDTLAALWAAYGALVKARTARDPLDLDLPERRNQPSAQTARSPPSVPRRGWNPCA